MVGAGATGVEIAGALAELVHDVMPLKYPDVDLSAARVIVVDLGHAPLGAFSDAAHAYATKQLDHRGVELMLGAGVTEVAPDHVTLTGETTIKTHLTVWGGGEMAAPVVTGSGLPVGRGGRVTVATDLTVDGFPGVYAVGDVANILDDDGGSAAAARQRRTAGGRLGRGQHPGRCLRLGSDPVPLPRQGHHGDDRPPRGGGRDRPHRHELHGRIAFAAWLGVHAALLSNISSELHAFMAWAEDFYVRPHHRSAALLDPSTIDTPRIHWGGSLTKKSPTQAPDSQAKDE